MSQEKLAVDVLCVGHASFDLIFSISDQPTRDDKTVAASFLSSGGGPAANAAVTVSRLGHHTIFAGYLGSDAFGEIHFNELEEEGVGRGFIVRGVEPTPISVSLVTPDGRRYLVNYRGDKSHLPEGSIDFSGIIPKVILFDGHEPHISRDLIEVAKICKAKTILDAGSVHMGTKELVSLVDHLVCSRKFARDFTGEITEEAAISKLIHYAPNVIITLGREGLIWKNSLGEGREPSLPVDVVDTTGAGDVFHGAFAVSIALEMDWEYSLLYSSAAAALSCTKLGARQSIPTNYEVRDLLSSLDKL